MIDPNGQVDLLTSSLMQCGISMFIAVSHMTWS